MKKLIMLGIMFVIPNIVFSQPVVEKNIAERNYEAAVVSMQPFSEFHGKTISQLFLYAYDNAANSFRTIPFQIDDKNNNGDYVFENPSTFVDEFDELVFMIKDMGDKIPDGFWLENADSRLFPRYEIEVDDTLRNNQKAWVYLFCSNTISGVSPTDYLDYNASSDQLNSDNYQVGFHSVNGLPANYKIIPGNNLDLLDRIKLRLKIWVKASAYGVTVDREIVFNENDIEKVGSIKSIDGSIRVIRSVLLKINKTISVDLGLFTLDFPINEEIGEFPIYFYPYNLKIQFGNIPDPGTINLPPEVKEAKFRLIRLSTDLNTNAVGMKFYNSYNTEDIYALQRLVNLINGFGGAEDGQYLDTSVNIPGTTWMISTGTQGAIISLFKVPAMVADTRKLYFDDSNRGSSDGTPDTGVDRPMSYGDAGIVVSSDNISIPGGGEEFSINTYLISGEKNIQFAEILNNNENNPVDKKITPQNYDTIPPAKITAIEAIPITNSSVKLKWTTSGDDGNSGTANHYDIRYSENQPQDMEQWFENATQVVNVPDPGSAGSQDSVIVQGLSQNSTYYFAIRVYDEAGVNQGGSGNPSEISAAVPGTTLPVELVSFSAEVNGGIIQLTWRTASEKNNLGFELYRKRENEEYTKIAFVAGNGTTSEPQSYSYSDRNITRGVYYYRLKQIDMDGKFRNYDEIEVSVSAPTSYALYQNYPNPFNPSTTLEFDLAKDGPARLVIYNVSGQVVKVVVDGFREAGHHSEEITVPELPSGIYFARLTSGNQTFVKKMILLE